MSTGIYIIISPMAKVYIGQSVDINKRYRCYQTKPDKGQGRVFKSIVKYGFDAHFFEIIEECAVEDLNLRERHWQDQYDVLGEYGLNLKLTKTTDKSGHLSDETKRKISLIKKGVKFKLKEPRTEKYMANMIASITGLKKSPEHKQKIADAMKGRKFSEETRRKISQARLSKRIPKESIENSNNLPQIST